MTSIIDENTVTVAEAAELLHVSQSTIWRWIKQGDLPAYHVGKRHVRIRRADLEQMVQPAMRAVETGTDDDTARLYELTRPTPEQIEENRKQVRRLTEEESQRALQAFERLRELRQEMLHARGGVPFSDSTEIIHQMREERTRELMAPHEPQ